MQAQIDSFEKSKEYKTLEAEKIESIRDRIQSKNSFDMSVGDALRENPKLRWKLIHSDETWKILKMQRQHKSGTEWVNAKGVQGAAATIAKWKESELIDKIENPGKAEWQLMEKDGTVRDIKPDPPAPVTTGSKVSKLSKVSKVIKVSKGGNGNAARNEYGNYYQQYYGYYGYDGYYDQDEYGDDDYYYRLPQRQYPMNRLLNEARYRYRYKYN